MWSSRPQRCKCPGCGLPRIHHVLCRRVSTWGGDKNWSTNAWLWICSFKRSSPDAWIWTWKQMVKIWIKWWTSNEWSGWIGSRNSHCWLVRRPTYCRLVRRSTHCRSAHCRSARRSVHWLAAWSVLYRSSLRDPRTNRRPMYLKDNFLLVARDESQKLHESYLTSEVKYPTSKYLWINILCICF